MTIISLIALGWALGTGLANGQMLPAPTPAPILPAPTPANDAVLRPRFAPATVLPTGYAQPEGPQAKPERLPNQPGVGERNDIAELNLRTELPGQQRLFMRQSEADFYDRIRQEALKSPGALPAIFPAEEPVISKEVYVHPTYPRLDPRTKLPVASLSEIVEPCYVIHPRLLFEQPNFERKLYDLGVAQPLVSLGVFYYDVAMAPYHFWSDLRDRDETSAGKCMPGDPAPFTIPCEKFSVTGLVGEFGTIVGLSFLFP